MSVVNLGNGAPKKKAAKKPAKKKAPAMKAKGMKNGGAPKNPPKPKGMKNGGAPMNPPKPKPKGMRLGGVVMRSKGGAAGGKSNKPTG
tara:strand:- start:395 stop:658 length:264 start_codon:yes stop_codon:yes gene_type:complete